MVTKKRTARRAAGRVAASARSRSVKRILNCLPSRKPETDWPAASAYDAGLVAAVPIPPKKDLRAPWWTIGDQSNTGSCVGWASADSVIRWYLAMAGRIPKDSGKRLSPRYIWMAAKETDEFTSRPTSFIESDGTSLKAALDIARKFGVVFDSVLPFASGTLYQGRVEVFYALASTLRISGYFSLRPPTAPASAKSALLQSWRKWIASGGPILTRLNVDDTWDNVGRDGKLNTYHPNTTTGGHAVALVGYDPNCFIVRNSWGKAWGDKGFAYASNDYAFAAFTELYGVSL
jgi:hypothetical protein